METLAPMPNAVSLPDVIAQCSAALPAAPIATDVCDGPITATTTYPVEKIAPGIPGTARGLMPSPVRACRR